MTKWRREMAGELVMYAEGLMRQWAADVSAGEQVDTGVRWPGLVVVVVVGWGKSEGASDVQVENGRVACGKWGWTLDLLWVGLALQMCKNGKLCFLWGYVLDYFSTGCIFILMFFVKINKLDITCYRYSRGAGRLFFCLPLNIARLAVSCVSSNISWQ